MPTRLYGVVYPRWFVFIPFLQQVAEHVFDHDVTFDDDDDDADVLRTPGGDHHSGELNGAGC